jgi:PAS domain S-box-containing protein
MSKPRQPAPSDRDQLRQIVAGLAEGVILLERNRTLVWANTSACAMHGVDKPADLGRTIAEYRKRFVLHYRNHHKVPAANYPIERAVAGDTFSDVVVEVTPVANPELKWVHRSRSFAINDASGTPDVYALFLVDVTDWASAEQRFEKAFGANPAPAIICRLSDLRYIKVNHGFLDMSGYASDQVIGRSVYELDVLNRAPNREDAIARLASGTTIPQTEAEVRCADGSSKLIVVAGQPIEVGEEACMLFTFMDLEPRRKVEIALRHSEERFAKAFAISPIPTLVCRSESLEVTDSNEAVATTTGYVPEELRGRSIADLGFLDSGITRTRILALLRKTGALSNVECLVTRKDGDTIDCVVCADSVRIDGEECLLVTMLDITHRKRREMELVEAVEAVMKDASWFSRPLIERLANVRRGSSLQSGPELADLTNRERDVLALIGEGLSDKVIAARLHLSPRTARNHAASIYAKIDVHTRAEAMLWARDRGFSAKTTTARKKPASRR